MDTKRSSWDSLEAVHAITEEQFVNSPGQRGLAALSHTLFEMDCPPEIRANILLGYTTFWERITDEYMRETYRQMTAPGKKERDEREAPLMAARMRATGSPFVDRYPEEGKEQP